MIGVVRTRIASLVFVAFAGLAACKQDMPPAIDAAGVSIDAPPGVCMGGTIAYLGACTMTSECGSCVCQSFGHSMVCTKSCTGPADCPAPSPGCGGGFCRP
jgi:hypothetical protein